MSGPNVPLDQASIDAYWANAVSTPAQPPGYWGGSSSAAEPAPAPTTLDPSTIPAFDYGAHFSAGKAPLKPTPSPIQVEGYPTGPLPGATNLAPLLGTPQFDMPNAFGAPPPAKVVSHAEGGAPQPGEPGGPSKPSTPTAPEGPTAAEDREFAALKAGMASRGPAPAPAPGGGGGGVPRGPSALDRATASLRGTYDLDKEALARGTEAERARADVNAVGAAAIAQQKIDDQAIQQMEAETAAKRFADYSAETQRQIDDVRAQKFNPNERYADTGSALMAIIGGALGGLYQGLNKTEKNPFVEQMNKNIDVDFRAFEMNQRTQKEALGDRRHLLAEMRSTYKDKALADLQARNLYYEGAKEAIAAAAAGYDSPTIKARGDQAINAMTREQSKLDIHTAMQKAAAAMAAAAAADARAERAWKHKLELDERNRKWAETGISAEKLNVEHGKEARTNERADRKEIVEGNARFLEKHPEIPEAKRLGELIRGPDGKLDTSGGHLPEGLSKWDGVVAELPFSQYFTSAATKNNRNAYEGMHLLFRHELTGAAFKDKEAEQVRLAFDGAGTAAEKSAAIAKAANYIESHQNLIAQHNPKIAAELGLYPAAKGPIDRQEGAK